MPTLSTQPMWESKYLLANPAFYGSAIFGAVAISVCLAVLTIFY